MGFEVLTFILSVWFSTIWATRLHVGDWVNNNITVSSNTPESLNHYNYILTWSIGECSLGGSGTGFEFVWSCLGDDATAGMNKNNKYMK